MDEMSASYKTFRQKTCKFCKSKFTPVKAMQQTCLTAECSYGLVVINKAKKKAKEYLEAKKRIKSRADWLREAQAAVNKYVRLRDEGKPCISCGRHHQGQWHAGHYRSVGACPELRFEPLNIHRQCAPCNNHLSGNIINYRIGLIERVGAPAVEWLEGKHEQKHYSIEEIQEIKTRYARMARELEHG